ncbi:hypothetical protein [Chamaesiphon polymorphus]|uniref:Uncharacterized protein n=1 Tax=Chamaesiphon polymorphus CCALA 037 TaxID=2107692 RepID=A0A2T1GFI5_9CYAN|nr:hypothetical protein [Chamaesiphon polymorphus]PSB56286.1 hypothetical protein C7B77_12350 [Chamaesiphon polymorphus CCALA 037]
MEVVMADRFQFVAMDLDRQHRSKMSSIYLPHSPVYGIISVQLGRIISFLFPIFKTQISASKLSLDYQILPLPLGDCQLDRPCQSLKKFTREGLSLE